MSPKKRKGALRKAGNEAQLALLPSLLPNIKVLDIQAKRSLALEFPWTMAFIRRAAKNVGKSSSVSRPLSRLEAIVSNAPDVFHRTPDPYWPSPTALACVMGLPALEEILIERPFGASENDDHVAELRWEGRTTTFRSNIEWPKKTSAVERLALWKSYSDSVCIRNIITACKTLRSFTISWPEQCYGDNESAGIRGLIASLSFHKDTLEHVQMDMGYV